MRNLLFGVLLCLASFNTFAVLIDFEALSLGTEVNTQFQALGVTFSSPGGTTGLVIGEFSGFSTTGNVLQDSIRPISPPGIPFQIIADFGPEVFEVSVIAYANPSLGLVMEAFDSTDALLGSITSTSGGEFNQGLISLSGIGAISRVRWTTTSPFAGGPGIDNLNFELSTVPEPATLALLSLGLMGICWQQFQSSKKGFLYFGRPIRLTLKSPGTMK